MLHYDIMDGRAGRKGKGLAKWKTARDIPVPPFYTETLSTFTLPPAVLKNALLHQSTFGCTGFASAPAENKNSARQHSTSAYKYMQRTGWREHASQKAAAKTATTSSTG